MPTKLEAALVAAQSAQSAAAAALVAAQAAQSAAAAAFAALAVAQLEERPTASVEERVNAKLTSLVAQVKHLKAEVLAEPGWCEDSMLVLGLDDIVKCVEDELAFTRDSQPE